MWYSLNFPNCAPTLFLLALLCTSTQGHGPSQAVSRLIIHSTPDLSPANGTNGVFSFRPLKDANFTPYPIATLSLPKLPKIKQAFSVLSMYSKGDSKFETYVLEIEGKYCCHGHGHSHHHGHSHGHSHDQNQSSGSFIQFFYAFLGVTVTNLCSITGFICIPLRRWKRFNYVMNFMIGLAVSALFSAAVLVLIPESLRLEEVPLEFGGQGFGYLTKLGCVPVGLMVVFIVEYLLLIAPRVFNLERPEKASDSESNLEDKVDDAAMLKMHGASTSENQEGGFKFTQIAPVAWMILLGDSIHNFMDGMAITAGFRNSNRVGLTLSLCVLLEELPHELGDFAVLISSGFSVKTALCVNFLSACAAYVGMAAGWFVGEEASGAFYVFAGMAGIFLYISLSDMLPSLLRVLESLEKKNKSSLSLFVIQSTGLIVGCLCVSGVMLGGHSIMH